MRLWDNLFYNKKKDLLDVIDELFKAPTASDVLQLIEQHSELLSEEADSMLFALSKDTSNQEVIDLIQNCRKILAYCREVGIAQVSEVLSGSSNEILQEDLQNLIDEINSLSRPQDMPRRIMLLQHALSLVQPHSNPEAWAFLQTELGNSLAQNPQGNQDDNMEQAIEHYHQALLYALDFPLFWAEIQNNLGNAYVGRVQGDRGINIEQAIEHYLSALKVLTYEDYPISWAKTQINLGLTFIARILGNKAENIERAIEHFNKALDVYTLQDFPFYWAQTHNGLGLAYFERIRGDRAENIEQAIEHHNLTLKVRKHIDFPKDWAATMNNLASAYSFRKKGDKAENIERAIEYCYLALSVRTKKNFPRAWAETQNNLGLAYFDRIRGVKAENIEQAIEHYNLALEVRTYKDLPIDWAQIHNNLGLTYVSRIWGDKVENIERAIEHFNQALDVYTLQDFPFYWAQTQNNLASAYKKRIRGNRAENIENAISCIYNALKFYKLELFPNEFRWTCRLLGDLYLDNGNWNNALESYKEAIKAGNFLYCSGLSAESKSVEVKESYFSYRNASLAAYRLGKEKEALQIFEEGKTLLLSELLRLKMKVTEGFPKEEWIKYEQAAEKYENVIKYSGGEKKYALKEEEAKEALKELEAALKVVQNYNPEFKKELEISDILSLADDETALLTFCMTDRGSIGFLISESNGIQSVDIPDFKTKDLNNLLFNYDEQSLIKSGLIVDYLSYTESSNTNRHEAFNIWKNTLSNILSIIGNKLLSPLLAKLLPNTKRLIILPSGGLFLLPLHTVLLSDGQPLCQRYCITYAPSIQLLKEMQIKARTVKEDGFYAIINPEEDPNLVFSEYEIQVISKFFKSPQVNIGETGTKSTVLSRIPEKAYLHFSCHGSYNWNDPSQSGLHLVEGRTINLADLQNNIVDLSSARLVTLSACESGVIDVLRGSADEFVGLPAGFMLAGVPCVVSSLWSVPDISTAMLMERFYSNRIVGGMDIPNALQDAQLWVRDLTSREVSDYVEKCCQMGKWEGKRKVIIEQYRESYLKIAEEYPDEKPFLHPYYWAAFTVNGA